MNPALVMVLLLLLAAGADAAERLVARSHRVEPDWVAKPPAAGLAGMVYFVGVREKARTLAEGRDGAFRDAAGQAAGFIETKVTESYLSRRSQEEASIVDEMRSSARGRVLGTRIIDLYWEKYLDNAWFMRDEHFRVWVLVGIPQTEIASERQRLESLRTALETQLQELCRSEAQWLRDNARGIAVMVAGFHEPASNKAYSFSRIVEERLSGCLSQKGVKVVQSKGQDFLSSGSYYRVGGDAVAISAWLTRLADGAKLFAQTVTFPDDAIEPSWLKVEEPRQDDFFAGLERWETKRALAVGRLAVDSTPRGARVLLDGEDRGKTPVEFPEVPVGSHGVVLSLPGYNLHSETALVQPEQTVRLEPRLAPKTGMVELVTTPPAAAVFLGGRRRGLTPITLELPAGPVEIVLRLEQFKERKISLLIPNKEKLTRTEVLEEEPGGLAVISDPEGAEVFVDDEAKRRGQTPLRIDRIEAGRHVVHLEKKGFDRASGEAVIHADRYAQVMLTLDRAGTNPVTSGGGTGGDRLWIDDPALRGDPQGPASELVQKASRFLQAMKTSADDTLKRFEWPPAGPATGQDPSEADAGANLLAGDYLDLFGGSTALAKTRHVGVDQRQGMLAEAHIVKYMHFFDTLRLGIGTSLLDYYWPGDFVTVQTTAPGSLESSNQRPAIVCFFPIHLMAAPFGLRRRLGNTVGAPMLYYNFTAWGFLDLKNGPPSYNAFSALIQDAGVSLPVGHWLALKAGWFQLRQSAFSASQDGLSVDEFARTKTITTTWQVSGINDQRWYAALEFHLGGMR